MSLKEQVMDLYKVTTIVKEFDGCKNVQFKWFHCERTSRPYADLIEGYDPFDDNDHVYAESCIDEMFTLEEAHALKEFLDHYDDEGTTTIKKAELPIPKSTM